MVTIILLPSISAYSGLFTHFTGVCVPGQDGVEDIIDPNLPFESRPILRKLVSHNPDLICTIGRGWLLYRSNDRNGSRGIKQTKPHQQ